MILFVLLACGGGRSTASTCPDTPHPGFARVVTAPSDAHGDWYVTWDRSWAGWWPTTFNGEMVLADDYVSLALHETSATYVLESVTFDGATVVVEAHTTPYQPAEDATDEQKSHAGSFEHVQIRGSAEGDVFLGYMQWVDDDGSGVGWAPFYGKRAAFTNPPDPMATTDPG